MASAPPAPLVHLPFIHVPILINPLNFQSNPNSLCARIERRLAGCFEAYGHGKRGSEKCRDLFYDFYECQHFTFQTLRYRAIQKERMKQYREGKLESPYDEHIPIDGLIYYI